MEFPGKLSLQFKIFTFQFCFFLLLKAVIRHSLRDDKTDDRQKTKIFIQRHVAFKKTVHAQSADGLLIDLDRNTDKGNAVTAKIFPGSGPVQEERLFPDIRYGNGLAGLHNLSCDPFPDIVAAFPDSLIINAVGDLDREA